MICTLTAKDGIENWCEHHQMFHAGHYTDYAIDPGDKGERFRKLWDKMARGENTMGSSEPRRLLRSLPMAKQCINLGTQNPPEKAGCGSCVTWNCAIKGKVKLAHCTGECGDWKKKESEPGAMSFDPIRFDHFNLHPGAIPGVRFNSSIIESI